MALMVERRMFKIFEDESHGDLLFGEKNPLCLFHFRKDLRKKLPADHPFRQSRKKMEKMIDQALKSTMDFDGRKGPALLSYLVP